MAPLFWPFSHIRGRRRATPFVALHGPLCSARATAYFQDIRAHYRLIGFTSHTDFPRAYKDRLDLDWLSACEGWCHCFRDPSQFLPKGPPFILISYSDFVDCRPRFPIRVPKKYDVGFVCSAGTWKEHTKNWHFAVSCFSQLLAAPPLRIVVIGHEYAADV